MAKYKIIPSSRTIVQSPISIGHKAEKGVEAIEFDLTAWVETYGSGTLTVIMRRWGDAIPYPIALEIDENNKATWTLSDIDTAKAGMAYAQLSYIVGETVVKKSDIYTFRVMDSLVGEGEPPEAYESWLEQLTHLAAEAMAEVLDIEGIVTDKTLSVDGGIADAKATGDALALKANQSTTYTKTEVDALIESVDVETDTTLSVSGKPADAKKTGDEISAIKADLDAIESSVTTTETKTLTYDDIEWEGGYMKANGDITTHAAYKVSELLPVSAGDSVVYDGLRTLGNGYIAIAAYDSNEAVQTAKSLTGSDSSSMSGTYTVPDGISYIRLSTYVSATSSGITNYFNSVTMPVSTSRFESLDNSLTEIEAEQTAQAAQIAELAQDNYFEYTVTGFEPYGISTSGRVDNHGDVQTHSTSVHSDYLSTEGMVSITAHIKGVKNNSAVVAAYDENHNFISGKSIIASDPEAVSGSWCYGDGTITITDDVKYIRICRCATASVSANDTITVVKYRSFVEDYRNTENRVDVLEEKTDSIWKGKKWYAFGTSLTDTRDSYHDVNGDPTGKYIGFLNEYMQADLVNLGRAGGGITSYSNGSILSLIQSTDFSDADLVTVEGFVNDYQAAPGTIEDATTDTLCGALKALVEAVYTTAPKATLVLITETQGQLNAQNAGWPHDHKSQTGHYQFEYNDAIINIGRFYGCHVIDAGSKSQINEFHPEYLVDHIHHSWAGGKQYADTIWEELKNIHPNTDNSYFETETDGE